MADKLYKVNEEIKIVYQAPNAESGLTNITMEIYDETGTKSSDYPDVTMSEIGSSGRYVGTFTPDAGGDWIITITKADGSGKVMKHYSIGDYNIDSLGTAIEGVSTDVAVVNSNVDGVVTELDAISAQVDTIDGKVDGIQSTSPPMVS